MWGAVIVMLRSRVLRKVHSKDHAVTAPRLRRRVRQPRYTTIEDSTSARGREALLLGRFSPSTTDRPSTGPTQYRTDPVPDRPSTGPARCRSDRSPKAVCPAVVPTVRHRSACRRARLSATGPLGRLAGRHTSRPPAVRRLSVACPARFGTHLSSALVRRDHSPSTRVLAPGFCLSLLTQVSVPTRRT